MKDVSSGTSVDELADLMRKLDVLEGTREEYMPVLHSITQLNGIKAHIKECGQQARAKEAEARTTLDDCRRLRLTAEARKLRADADLAMLDLSKIVTKLKVKDPSKIMSAWNASSELDEATAKQVVKVNGLLLRHLDEPLRANREVVLAAVQKTWWALKFAAMELCADREIMLAAVQQDGRALEYAASLGKALEEGERGLPVW